MSSPLSRSVRYCLKSWAAVWWLKRWQIDTFTHDRTLADRAQGERGRDEERESKWGRKAKKKKITSWQQGDPYFHKLKWMDRSGWVCVSLGLHPALFALFFSLFRIQVNSITLNEVYNMLTRYERTAPENINNNSCILWSILHRPTHTNVGPNRWTCGPKHISGAPPTPAWMPENTTPTPGMIKSGFDAAQRRLRNRWVTQDRGLKKDPGAAAEAAE